jgi:serine/threonine-protein kinase
LNHPNVVQVFDFGESQGTWFLVMEFIDGVNLRALFRKAFEANEPLGFPIAAKIVSLACEGLGYAHDFVDPATGQPMNLVHRDVSPDNILIARNGAVKVVDFGIAKVANQTQLTRTGTVKGKFSYMPPEQLIGLSLDRRADVFALGVVLHELVTGKKPFEASNEAAIVRAIMYEPPMRASSVRPDMPEALQAIIDKALMKNRDERYQSCREMQTDLERFIVSTGAPVSQYELAQVVQRLAPPPPQPVPTPTAPNGVPMGVPPTPATVHDVSNWVSATPPPSDEVLVLTPKPRRAANASPAPSAVWPSPAAPQGEPLPTGVVSLPAASEATLPGGHTVAPGPPVTALHVAPSAPLPEPHGSSPPRPSPTSVPQPPSAWGPQTQTWQVAPPGQAWSGAPPQDPGWPTLAPQ